MITYIKFSGTSSGHFIRVYAVIEVIYFVLSVCPFIFGYVSLLIPY